MRADATVVGTSADLRGPAWVASLLVLAVLYIVAAKLGLTMAFETEQVSAVWPPTGIALAAVLLLGPRCWPGIALGAFVANVTTHETVAVACGIALGNTLEALAGAWLLHRLAGFRTQLDRVRDVLSLLVLAALASTMVSATIGVTSLCLGGVQPWSAYGGMWRLWWLGDATGGLLVAPALLTWVRAPLVRWDARRAAEAIALGGAQVVAGLLVFDVQWASGSVGQALVYAVFVFVVWAALRFGQQGTTAVTIIASGLAVWGTAHGRGPFAAAPILERLDLLQVFMTVVAVTGLLLAALDAERARGVAALRESDRHKDEFLALLAHELRNPLGPIRNATEILRFREPAEAIPRAAREIIERQVAHMARLVGDLLDVSSLSRGKIHFEHARCDLTELVRHAVEDHRTDIESAGLRLTLQLPDELLWVFADATRLTQAVGNLLDNARKFTDADGSVSVRLQPDPDASAALITVRDTGIGMNADTLAHLFVTFHQADQTLARSRGGLGLGLALVKGLVEPQGGRVHAASDGPGRGSEFTLWLPLVPPPSERPQQAAAAPLVHPASRVLVVEDNADAALSLKVLLDLEGHHVEIARTGAEALELARRFVPDIILCDIGLPGMDGYAVARAIRDDTALADVCLIAMTGYGQESDRRRAGEAGFDLHLTKPVDHTELKRAMEL